MTAFVPAVSVLCALLLGLSPLTARAGLGENVAHIAQDRVVLRGTPVQVTRSGAYDRHELQTAAGVQVREFADRSGRIFAVTFNGPSKPDLKVLLGAHYTEYATATRPSVSTHKVYTHASGTLALSIVKLPRGFTGSAFIPDAVPVGVDPRQLLQ